MALGMQNNYPPSWNYPPGWPVSWPPHDTSSAPRPAINAPSIAEQMGIDPVSKLAAAIDKLADVLRETWGGTREGNRD